MPTDQDRSAGEILFPLGQKFLGPVWTVVDLRDDQLVTETTEKRTGRQTGSGQLVRRWVGAVERGRE